MHAASYFKEAFSWRRYGKQITFFFEWLLTTTTFGLVQNAVFSLIVQLQSFP